MRIFVLLFLSIFLLSCAGSREKEEAYIAQVKASSAAFYSEEARAALDQGDYASAIDNFRKAKELLPFDPGIQTNLGAAFFKAGNMDSAIAYYQNAVLLQPTYTRAYVNLGYAYLEQKNHTAAHSAALTAVEHSPEDPDPIVLRAKIFQSEKKYDQAIKAFNQAIQLARNDYQIHVDLGILFDERGQVTMAVEQYEKAAQLRPSRSYTYYLLGNAMARLCTLDEAQGYYEKALRLNPNLLAAHNNLGLVLMNIGAQETALDHFYAALEIDSTTSPVLFNLSVALDRIDSPSIALNYISRAIQIDSTFAVFYLQRGNIYMNLGLTDLALHSFHKAIALEPAHALVYNNLGNALLETENIKEAELAYQRALDLYPSYLENRYFNQHTQLTQGIDDLLGGCTSTEKMTNQYAMMFNNLGKSKLLLGKLDDAEKDLNRAARLQPLLVQPYENLAYLYQQRGEREKTQYMLSKARLNQARAFLTADSLDAALSTAKQALSFYPTHAECHAVMGQIYAAQQDSLAAVNAFKEALRLESTNAATQLTYAGFLRDHNNIDQAYVHILQAVELDPGNRDAHQTFAVILDSLGRLEEAAQQRALAHFLNGKEREFLGQWDHALQEYEEAMMLWPENALFPAHTGIIYIKKKLYTEAELFLNQALELNSDEVDALYGSGLLKGETGEEEESVDYLQRTIELSPEHELAHYALAMNYHNLGDHKNALKHLKKAKELGLALDSTIYEQIHSQAPLKKK